MTDRERQRCKGCGRLKAPAHKYGYCQECAEAIREDIRRLKGEERRAEKARGEVTA